MQMAMQHAHPYACVIAGNSYRTTRKAGSGAWKQLLGVKLFGFQTVLLGAMHKCGKERDLMSINHQTSSVTNASVGLISSIARLRCRSDTPDFSVVKYAVL